MFLILILLIFGTAPLPTHKSALSGTRKRTYLYFCFYFFFGTIFFCHHSHSLGIVLQCEYQCAHMAILHHRIHHFEFPTKLRWNVHANESQKQKWKSGAPSKRRHEFRLRKIIVVLLQTTKTNVSQSVRFCQLIISCANLYLYLHLLSQFRLGRTERWKINMYISFQFQLSVKEEAYSERWPTLLQTKKSENFYFVRCSGLLSRCVCCHSKHSLLAHDVVGGCLVVQCPCLNFVKVTVCSSFFLLLLYVLKLRRWLLVQQRKDFCWRFIHCIMSEAGHCGPTVKGVHISCNICCSGLSGTA